MQLPPSSVSAQTFINYGIYSAVRLEATAETKSWTGGLRNAIGTLKTLNRDAQDKAEDTSALLAIRDAKENDLDNAVMSLSLEILSEVKNNRTDRRYKNIFLIIPSAIVALPEKAKLEYIKLLEERLKADSQDLIYKKHVTLLKQLRTDTEQAQIAYIQSINAEQKTIDKETIAKEALGVILTKTYGKLIDLFNKKKAEIFFKKTIAKKKNPVVPPAQP